jgi:hypothetical protein
VVHALGPRIAWLGRTGGRNLLYSDEARAHRRGAGRCAAAIESGCPVPSPTRPRRPTSRTTFPAAPDGARPRSW